MRSYAPFDYGEAFISHAAKPAAICRRRPAVTRLGLTGRSTGSRKAEPCCAVPGRCIGKSELDGRVPYEVHLDAVRDTAGVRPDPRLVHVEDDSDLACPVVGLVARGLIVLKAPPVVCDTSADAGAAAVAA
jgi:hypothetical protein